MSLLSADCVGHGAISARGGCSAVSVGWRIVVVAVVAGGNAASRIVATAHPCRLGLMRKCESASGEFEQDSCEAKVKAMKNMKVSTRREVSEE